MQKKILKSVFKKLKRDGISIKVVYWDGEENIYGNGEPTLKVIFRKPFPAEFNFDLDDLITTLGEAYMDEIIDFEGSMEELIWIIDLNRDNLVAKDLGSKILSTSFKTLNIAKAKIRQKKDIQHHYDLGDDFFSLWLDETMSYSCAYFKNPNDSLLQAQIQKIDYLLKKLELRSDERLLDIGCGWGWLVIRAAQLFDIKAIGITISQEQCQTAQKIIAQLNLTDRVEVKLLDYLDLNKDEYQFDKIVSVGMFEHVGKENMPKYMKQVHELLKPRGVSILQTITKQKESSTNPWIQKYIFPGGYIPTLREIITLLPDYNFHLVHAESLRRHYAMTLDRWHEKFCQHSNEIEKKFDRRFVRMWGLYLQGCAASFRVSGLNVYQLLFTKEINNDLSLTLDHIFKS